jgi:Fe-S-cluster containining protein
MQTEILEITSTAAKQLDDRLRAARNPEHIDKVTKQFHDQVDRFFADTLARSGQTIACRAGCAFCCYIKVDATPNEIFRIAKFLNAHYRQEELDGIVERARANRDRIRAMSREQQLHTSLACPLLKNNQCMCYGVRPAMCRKHHAQDVEGCEAAFNKPTETVPSDEVPEVSLTLSAMVVQSQEVFRQNGFDSRSHLINS